ncbi:ribbon-helix-helix domain-containing protein [Sphingomonas floccifaciens]
MADLSVPLSTDLQSYVDARVAAEGFADPAAFVRALVQRDQDEYTRDVARVQRLIDEGIASGIIDDEPENILRQIMDEIPGRHG